MPLFNLIVSIWQHNLVLKNTIGVGFTKSIFTHSHGLCDLIASENEMKAVSVRVVDLVKKGDPSFKIWYEKAKILNKDADTLLAEYEGGTFDLTSDSFSRAFQVFADNFGYCTILSYWVLYGIGKALEKGESRESFASTLSMFEELKGETRYPQLIQTVMSKYFAKAAGILGVSSELITCIHPDELGQVLIEENSVDPVVLVAELEKRMKWCAITRGQTAYAVNFGYDQKELSVFDKINSDGNIRELKGSAAFKGLVRGRAKIVNAMDDMKGFEEGDILVSIQSSPSLMAAIQKCSAIVADEGGITCHASVISRELKKPCIIGTKVATKVIKNGDHIEVDADKGMVRIIKSA